MGKGQKQKLGSREISSIKCKNCGTEIPRTIKHETRCKCGNVSLKNNYGNLSVTFPKRKDPDDCIEFKFSDGEIGRISGGDKNHKVSAKYKNKSDQKPKLPKFKPVTLEASIISEMTVD